jgi:hypothetical protein
VYLHFQYIADSFSKLWKCLDKDLRV